MDYVGALLFCYVPTNTNWFLLLRCKTLVNILTPPFDLCIISGQVLEFGIKHLGPDFCDTSLHGA